jgi:gas vesicle protein
MLEIWIGIAIGTIVAGIATLLFTPQSGKDTRKIISYRFSKAGEAIIWHARNEVDIARHKHDKPQNK